MKTNQADRGVQMKNAILTAKNVRTLKRLLKTRMLDRQEGLRTADTCVYTPAAHEAIADAIRHEARMLGEAERFIDFLQQLERPAAKSARKRPC